MSLVYVLDIETTAFKPHLGAIVEIGVASLDMVSGEIKPVYHAFVKDEAAIYEKAWIFSNSDLKVAEVTEKGVPIKEVVTKLNELFKGAKVTAFNKDFDFPWLTSRGVIIEGEYPCIMKDIMTPMMKLVGKNGKTKWPSVVEAIEHFKIKITEPHRALGDALIEATILRCAEKIGKEPNQFPFDLKTIHESISHQKKEENPTWDKTLRYQTKIKYYEAIIPKIVEQYTYLYNGTSSNAEKDILTESHQNTLNHIDGKLDFCRKEVTKLEEE